jgi:hypothetical protein
MTPYHITFLEPPIVKILSTQKFPTSWYSERAIPPYPDPMSSMLALHPYQEKSGQDIITRVVNNDRIGWNSLGIVNRQFVRTACLRAGKLGTANPSFWWQRADPPEAGQCSGRGARARCCNSHCSIGRQYRHLGTLERNPESHKQPAGEKYIPWV